MASIKTPLVSIVIPCYNGASTILEAVQSALDQSYKNIEIVVVDDGSTDNSRIIVEKIILSEPKVSLHTQENRGLSAARNFGLHQVKGEYVVFLDADDKLKETYLSLALAYYLENPDTTIVYSNMELFERETGLFPLDAFEIKSFLRQNCIPAFAMVRVKQIRAIGGFDESVTLCEDWECWMHLLKVFGGSVHRIEEPQYFYRKRITNDSILDRYKENTEKLKKVRVYVFSKHQEFYDEHNMDLESFYQMEDKLKKLTKKYYNTWYRRYFYKWFKPQKYSSVYIK
ncbi:glycosyltransferase family 2 protein [Sphingobacterium phlebotomi]|uniref:Glycosyltransferase family 2 protein n=1 Tax=Sphingobacterium phlebotomi TaxID=2605433 RepID=A0A5D4HC50_9SPHI|nr:glycosyltransferase family A protein [Sphingobacterium phlebotomi]TYR38238.1 glycosyltransferase family 2 protein [Sphingobacterium phlebotomi]